MVKIILPIFLLFAILFNPPNAKAQDDFPGGEGGITPFPSITVECCGGGGNDRGTSWGPETLWYVKEGDTVYLDFVMDFWERPHPVWLFPSASGVKDFKYLNGGPENHDPTTRWGRGDNGDWCWRCQFSFVATRNSPTIWIYFKGTRRFGAHLEVTRVDSPPPEAAFIVLPQAVKNTAGDISGYFTDASGVFDAISRAFVNSPYNGDVPHSAIFSLLAYANGKFAGAFDRIRRDPYDGNYCSSVDEWIDPQLEADIAWTALYDTASGGWIVQSTLLVEAYLRRAGTSADRAMSAVPDGNMECAQARKAEIYRNLNDAGYWMEYFRWAVRATADANADDKDNRRAMGDEAVNSLYQANDGLAYAASWVQGVQP